MPTTGASRCAGWPDEMGEGEPLFERAERTGDARHPAARIEVAAAFPQLGGRACGLVGAGAGSLPRARGSRRLLGLHRGEAPLHSLRHLSVRAALAARAREPAPRPSVGTLRVARDV